MDVTCDKGHAQTIADPSDEGWEYHSRDQRRLQRVTLEDGSTREVELTYGVPYERVLVWKCSAPAPTDENPAALCGSVQTITEAVEPPADATNPDTPPEVPNE